MPSDKSLEAMDQRAWEARSVFSGAVERMVSVSNAAEVADRLVAEALAAAGPPSVSPACSTCGGSGVTIALNSAVECPHCDGPRRTAVSPPEEPAEAIAEERQRILDALDVQEMWDEFNDAAIANVHATCPYRLKDGSLGAYGPNTCHGGCQEEPECVTGGPFEERDEMEAVRDYLVAIVSSAIPLSQEPPNAE